MPFIPEDPFPKERGQSLRSRDWNQLIIEVQRLDTDKVNKNIADSIRGPLTIQESLGIGAGITIPRAALHIAGGQSDVTTTEGDLRIGSDTNRLKIGVATGGGGAGDVRIRAQGGTNRLMLGSNTSDLLVIQNGNVNVTGSLSVAEDQQLSFGARTRQMINLWRTGYGIGVQAATQYFRSDADFCWHRGGTHNDERQNPGGGTRLMALNAAGDLILSARTNPSAASGGPFCRALVDFGNKLIINYENDFSQGLETGGSFGFSPPQGGDGTNEIQWTRSILAPPLFVSTDSTNYLKLSLFRRQLVGEADPTYQFRIGHPNQFLFGQVPINSFATKLSVSSNGDVSVAGRLSVQDITIRSGAKPGYVSDYFVNAVGDRIEQGDVVVLSEQPISHFYATQNDIPIPEVDLTTKAYDTRVCGIVAKVATEADLPYVEVENPLQIPPEVLAQIPPEVLQGQVSFEGLPEEVAANLQPPSHPLRQLAAELREGMNKKVVQDRQMGNMVTMGCFSYCKVDADIASIEVGDLLTTSPTKGHAQKVLEPARAVGAIIGKALGSLSQGKGKIPILVMLQ